MSTPTTTSSSASSELQLSDAANTAQNDEHPSKDSMHEPNRPSAPKQVKSARRVIFAMLIIAFIGILLILWSWRIGPFTTEVMYTDNAYVRGQVTVLAPQVSGYVVEVAVNDFDNVTAGQVLARIDDRTYAAKVQSAQAQLDNARAQLANSKQAMSQGQANLNAKNANLLAAQAEAQRAAIDLKRIEELAARGSVSLRERDQARATAKVAEVNVLKSRSDIDIGQQTIKSTQVSRGSLEAQVELAESQLNLAKIDLDNTIIRAPADGQLGEASVRVGQFVTAGSQLLFLVPKNLWVVANFKETQVANMYVGQPASFTVDALNGAKFTGVIDKMAPAMGSEFSVLRADNATGNFTKVVQRVPIRITLDPDQKQAERLKPGMSVEAMVDTSKKPEAKAANAASANKAEPAQ